jgi:hypothetical protein
MKTNNYITYSIVAVTILGAMILIGGNSNVSDSNEFSNSALTVMGNNFDFGTIVMANGNVSNQFEVRNEGGEEVIIERVYTSCMCTSAKITDASGKDMGTFGMPGHSLSPKTQIMVPAGGAVTLNATFDPAAHGPSGVGLAKRSIYLETNSKVSPKTEVSFQVTVIR